MVEEELPVYYLNGKHFSQSNLVFLHRFQNNPFVLYLDFTIYKINNTIKNIFKII